MSDRSDAGSQAGQQGPGSQAGQGAGQEGNQQGTTQGSGSQAGQSNGAQAQQPYFNEQYMQPGETVEQAFERYNGALATARKQAAGYRNRLGESSGSQAGQGQQGEGQQSQDDNDLTKRLANLEAELRRERQNAAQNKTRTQLIEALASEGAVNPTLAVRLIDFDTLDVGDDGTVTDALGPVRALKAAMPQVFTDNRGSGDGHAGNNGPADTSDMNTLIRQKARR